MLSNYIKLAFRNLAKYRRYAAINIIGLAIGLCIFSFSSIFIHYETHHDTLFKTHSRTYVIGSVFSPTAGETIRSLPSIKAIYGPLFKAEIEDAEEVVRSHLRQKMVTLASNEKFNLGIRFVDPGFTKSFDFNYQQGDASALDDPRGLILTVSAANTLFGRSDVLGEIIRIANSYEVRVTAIIEDAPVNTHFNASQLPNSSLAAVAPIEALSVIDQWDINGKWSDFSMYDTTYILLKQGRTQAWLTDQVNAIAKRHAPSEEFDYISAPKTSTLGQLNTAIWESFGFPVIESLRILGILILLIACVNYANLATAQNFNRTREVGLRKTLGATRHQLFTQFLVESIFTSLIALLFAIAALEVLVPIFNQWSGKIITIEYLTVVPWLVLVTFFVGILSGAYPSYTISQVTPVKSLNRTIQTGRIGTLFRNGMIFFQFSISIFILAMVFVFYFQNKKVEHASNSFPKDHIVILEKIKDSGLDGRFEVLKSELNNVSHVSGVSFSQFVPFSQANPSRSISASLDSDRTNIDVNMYSIDEDFMDTYDIALLYGRAFDKTRAQDTLSADSNKIHIIINQIAAHKLGYSEANDALGGVFYTSPDDKSTTQYHYIVIGVMEDVDFNGLFNGNKPLAFYINPESHNYASIRISPDNVSNALEEIDHVWAALTDKHPIRRIFLDDNFNMVFRFFRGANNVLTTFAVIALSLALIGLYGNATFMTHRRTKEIGIRKVMGASIFQISRLLVWQFSFPVLWSFIVAIPLAYFVSGRYLSFFSDKITFVTPIIVLACAIGLITAWVIVAGHAIRIARIKPSLSLRYE